jgi:hypothetical protein
MQRMNGAPISYQDTCPPGIDVRGLAGFSSACNSFFSRRGIAVDRQWFRPDKPRAARRKSPAKNK